VLGDAILFGLDDQKVNISGRPTVPNWVAYHAETGGYDVRVTRDIRTAENGGSRLTFRYQVQGPRSSAVLRDLFGGALPDIPFFRIGVVEVCGKKIHALNHGMSRNGGLELFGPAEFGTEIREAILKAGKPHGIKAAGGREKENRLRTGILKGIHGLGVSFTGGGL